MDLRKNIMSFVSKLTSVGSRFRRAEESEHRRSRRTQQSRPIKLSRCPIIQPTPAVPLSIEETDSPERRALVEQVRRYTWYHTLELPHGVTTPGMYDHRLALHLYGLPDSLEGKRVLDVATFDGFWAFELERRGAGSVVTMDLASRSEWDIPRPQRERFLASGNEREMGAAFKVAHEALDSNVERKILNVYDLSPETAGEFDFVYCGDLLIHLRDPNLALQNIFSVTRDEAIFAEPFDPELVRRGAEQQVTYLGAYNYDLVWWMPSPRVWEQMILGAGFSHVERISAFRLDYPNGSEGPWRAVYRARR